MPSLMDYATGNCPDPLHNPVRRFVLMSLNALAYVVNDALREGIRRVFDATEVSFNRPAAARSPAVLLVFKDARAVLAFEGTRSINDWWGLTKFAGGIEVPGDPGRLYSPFVDAARTEETWVRGSVRPQDRIFMTGHSLGGAIAAVLGRWLRQSGSSVQSVVGFGTPRFGSPNYLSSYPVDFFDVSHTNDPVPYLPPHVLFTTDPETDPASVGGYSVPGTIIRLTRAISISGITHAKDTGKWIAILRANSDIKNSPHTSYQYVLNTYAEIEQVADLDFVQPLLRLLEAQGLTSPWPG